MGFLFECVGRTASHAVQRHVCCREVHLPPHSCQTLTPALHEFIDCAITLNYTQRLPNVRLMFQCVCVCGGRCILLTGSINTTNARGHYVLFPFMQHPFLTLTSNLLMIVDIVPSFGMMSLPSRIVYTTLNCIWHQMEAV